MDDLISRQTAIAYAISGRVRTLPTTEDGEDWIRVSEVRESLYAVPSAQTELLTDDDFETIRIHLSAFKEDLCNQHRWKEAEDYERLINRFISFASAQSEIIRCKDCKWYGRADKRRFYRGADCLQKRIDTIVPERDFCSRGERKES